MCHLGVALCIQAEHANVCLALLGSELPTAQSSKALPKPCRGHGSPDCFARTHARLDEPGLLGATSCLTCSHSIRNFQQLGPKLCGCTGVLPTPVDPTPWLRGPFLLAHVPTRAQPPQLPHKNAERAERHDVSISFTGCSLKVLRSGGAGLRLEQAIQNVLRLPLLIILLLLVSSTPTTITTATALSSPQLRCPTYCLLPATLLHTCATAARYLASSGNRRRIAILKLRRHRHQDHRSDSQISLALTARIAAMLYIYI